MARAWLFLVAACGRVGFDRAPTDSASVVADTRGSADAPATVLPPEFVQHTASTDGNTETITAAFVSPVAAGDLVIAGLDYGGAAGGQTLTSVADTFGDSYALLGPYTGDVSGTQTSVYLAYTVASQSGTDALTATLDANAGFLEFRIHEYANTASSPLDTTIGSNGGTTGSDAAAATITTAAAEELIFAMVIDGTVGAGTGYTLRGSDYEDLTEDRVAATASTYPVLGSPSGDWVMIAAAFRGR
jgi:hypothetical protein